jgi:hypothetical protein
MLAFCAMWAFGQTDTFEVIAGKSVLVNGASGGRIRAHAQGGIEVFPTSVPSRVRVEGVTVGQGRLEIRDGDQRLSYEVTVVPRDPLPRGAAKGAADGEVREDWLDIERGKSVTIGAPRIPTFAVITVVIRRLLRSTVSATTSTSSVSPSAVRT